MSQTRTAVSEANRKKGMIVALLSDGKTKVGLMFSYFVSSTLHVPDNEAQKVYKKPVKTCYATLTKIEDGKAFTNFAVGSAVRDFEQRRFIRPRPRYVRIGLTDTYRKEQPADVVQVRRIRMSNDALRKKAIANCLKGSKLSRKDRALIWEAYANSDIRTQVPKSIIIDATLEPHREAA